MTERTKIVIEIKGGVLVWLGSSEEVDVLIIDKDCEGHERDVYSQDMIVTEEQFNKIKETGDIDEIIG